MTVLASSMVQLGSYLDDAGPRVALVVVFGDADPALAGALAALKSGRRLVHVEAGARRAWSEQEERNRIVIDSVADLNLCVTKRCVSVLLEEAVRGEAMHVGDLALAQFWRIVRDLGPPPGISDRKDVVVAFHRPFNVDRSFLAAVATALRGRSVPSLWVCHPRIRSLVDETVAAVGMTNATVLPPLPHGRILRAMRHARYVLTDSGGLIREAHLLGRHVLVARHVGGWVELIEAGANRYLGRSAAEIDESLAWADRVWMTDASLSPSPLVVDGGLEGALSAVAALADRSQP